MESRRIIINFGNQPTSLILHMKKIGGKKFWQNGKLIKKKERKKDGYDVMQGRNKKKVFSHSCVCVCVCMAFAKEVEYVEKSIGWMSAVRRMMLSKLA